ncbi:unnamed protein product [Toxocara canis]|uniref:Phosphatidate cytidylyltransferase n=1 Tax=Toxocara canis TaxID=6265 RepID=A0A183V975_TOXCA|nr:unnamed protein product [Toxocara canis]
MDEAADVGGESGVRQRKGVVGDSHEGSGDASSASFLAKPTQRVATSDESDADPIVSGERLSQLTKDLPQGSDALGAYIDPVLAPLPSRWRNWVVRGIFSLIMISLFSFIIKLGPTWLMALVFVIQFWCFHEIISIGLAVYRLYDLPWFRALSWYFLLSSNYFFFGESLIDYWGILLRKDQFLHFMVVHHRLISFTLYCIGFVWFLVPVSMIICCDIMSYIFGFFFGKTPLIKLSPKKTWEGFVGGAISTVLFGLTLSYFLVQHPFFVCPLEDYAEDNTNCSIPSSFLLREFEVGRPFSFVLRMLKKPTSVQLYPFLFHAVIMALFASLLGPFGGFFASGFKRAFKIKDFGDVIPGHGGLMDRFDCQLLMGTFVNVYIHTFIKVPNAGKLLQQIFWLTNDEQLFVYRTLQEHLIHEGLLQLA